VSNPKDALESDNNKIDVDNINLTKPNASNTKKSLSKVSSSVDVSKLSNNNRYKDNQSNLNTKIGVSTPKSGKLLNSKGSESNLNNI